MRISPRISMYHQLEITLSQAFYRETLMWKGLSHDHVMFFLGVSEDALPNKVCMVLPWMENGSVMKYLEAKLQGDHSRGVNVSISIMVKLWVGCLV